MARYNAQYRCDSALGKRALAQIENVQAGDVIRDDLLPGLPEQVKWRCIEANQQMRVYTFAGSWCGIPLMTVEIRVELGRISLRVLETTC